MMQQQQAAASVGDRLVTIQGGNLRLISSPLVSTPPFKHTGRMSLAMFQQQQAAASVGDRFVAIRRGHLLEDGYDRLAPLGNSLKGRVRVQFISEHGDPEAGVVSDDRVATGAWSGRRGGA